MNKLDDFVRGIEIGLCLAILLIFLNLFPFAKTAKPATVPRARVPSAEAARKTAVIKHLQKALGDYADLIVNDPRFALDPTLFPKRAPGEPKPKPKPRRPMNYDYVFSEWSLERSQKFLDANAAVLEHAEQRFRIPKELITGIFNIESQWGAHLGKRPVVTTLYTLAIVRPNFVAPGWSEEQLIIFLRNSRKIGFDPFSIKGSWAGAFGIPQFEPSSYDRLALHYDSEKRECVKPAEGIFSDLFAEADAICSVANFLRDARYGPSESQKDLALTAYIRDHRYHQAVLDFTDYLQKKTPPHRYRFVDPKVRQRIATP